ncbi:MAG: hypothetical protein ACTSX9_02525 [Candidatus Njordarchaeales archaeon]
MSKDIENIPHRIVRMVKEALEKGGKKLDDFWFDIVFWLASCIGMITEHLYVGVPPAEGYILEKITRVLVALGIYPKYRHVIFGDLLPCSTVTITGNTHDITGGEHLLDKHSVPSLVDYFGDTQAMRELLETMDNEKHEPPKFGTLRVLRRLLGEPVGDVALVYLRMWSCEFKRYVSVRRTGFEGLVAKIERLGLNKKLAEQFVKTVMEFCTE